MKQKIFTFLLIAAAGLTACKKDKVYPDIKEYDETSIQTYLTSNSLTGFTKGANDTTGIYYKILMPGTGKLLDYSDEVSIVYTMKTFDGKYVATDTITNHYSNLLGHLTAGSSLAGSNTSLLLPPPLPIGLQTAIHDLLKNKGGSMHVIIPSHLAYGKGGYITRTSTGSINIVGNQSLDMYVHVIDNQATYDDIVIQNYIKANNLTGYAKDEKGYYYKVITAGTGTIGEIKEFSNVTSTYKGYLMNGVVFADKSTASAETPFSYQGITGLGIAIQKYGSAGASLSFIFPSKLGYGASETGGGTVIIPSSSCTRFDYQITTVTQP
jgi:FKBP-type peptidyl-prolyl cis-trans isomerase FkpA